MWFSCVYRYLSISFTSGYDLLMTKVLCLGLFTQVETLFIQFNVIIAHDYLNCYNYFKCQIF